MPISAKLIANLIERAGADRVLTMELHAEQIQGFFDIPVDHLYSTPVLVDFFLKRGVDGCCVVAPDTGRANRARGFAQRLMEKMPLAVIDKRRPEPNKAVVMNVVGEVEGLDAIIFDDMVDTGKTLILAARALLKRGARSVMAVATHGVFSGDAVAKLQASPLDEMIVTDTLPLPRKKQVRKIRVLPVASLFADTIHNFGDAAIAIPLWIAFIFVRKKPTNRFTYGYGRVEDLAGIAVVLAILISGVVVGYESLSRLFTPSPVEHLWAVVVASVVGFLGNEAVAVYRIRVGRAIGT